MGLFNPKSIGAAIGSGVGYAYGGWVPAVVGGSVGGSVGGKLGGLVGIGGANGTDPYTGMPLYPQYENPLAIGGDEGVEKVLKDRGLSTGASPWANMMRERQGLDTNLQLDAARMQNQGAFEQGRNALAMQGGFSSGARERLARAGSEALAGRQQQIMSDAGRNNLAIGIEDESNKMGLLERSQERALRASQANSLNSQGKNAYNLGRYQTQMQGWAGNQQANAIENSGKK